MTPAQRTETPEALEKRAAKLRAEAENVEAELRRQADEKRAELAARQEAWDRQFVEQWDRPGLDAEVERTTAELGEALRADPLVQALAAVFHARSRRRVLSFELTSAMSRLGRDVSGASLPDPPGPPSVAELVATTVERMSAELIAAEKAQLEAARNGENQQ